MNDDIWKSIAGPLINVGATTLGTVVGGPAGAAIGRAVGPILAGALGVPANPAAVGQAILANPTAVRQVEMTPEVQQAIEQAQTEHLRIINETFRKELESEQWFIKFARPAWMWTGCLVWGVHGLALGYAMFTRQFEVIKVIPELTAFYIIMGGVAGVYAWRRSDEKKASG